MTIPANLKYTKDHEWVKVEGDTVTFEDVLLVKDDNGVKVGTPTVDGAVVNATLLEEVKADKVLVFKKKRRQV